MIQTKEVFIALPHVNEIWVTEDGQFHLHPHNGGELVRRSQTEDESLPEIAEIPQQTEDEPHPAKRGRKKLNQNE